MAAMTAEETWDFLMAGTRTAQVATVRADGRPHVKPVWFELSGKPGDFEVLFTTAAATVAGRNLARDGRVMISVDDPVPPFSFVLIEGTAVHQRGSGGAAGRGNQAGCPVHGCRPRGGVWRPQRRPRRADRPGVPGPGAGAARHRGLTGRPADCAARGLRLRTATATATAQRVGRRATHISGYPRSYKGNTGDRPERATVLCHAEAGKYRVCQRTGQRAGSALLPLAPPRFLISLALSSTGRSAPRCRNPGIFPRKAPSSSPRKPSRTRIQRRLCARPGRMARTFPRD